MEAAVEGALLIGLHVQELGRIATNIITARLLGTTNTNNAQVIFVTPPCAPNVRDLIMYFAVSSHSIIIFVLHGMDEENTHERNICMLGARFSPVRPRPRINIAHDTWILPTTCGPNAGARVCNRMWYTSRAIPHKITRQIGRPLRLCGLLS